jgi:hypothetical protein
VGLWILWRSPAGIYLLTAGSIGTLRAAVALARELRLGVIAEGVETAALSSLLAEADCEQAQGYHFSRPISAEHATDLLRHPEGLLPEHGDFGRGPRRSEPFDDPAAPRSARAPVTIPVDSGDLAALGRVVTLSPLHAIRLAGELISAAERRLAALDTSPQNGQ